jgi:hypothetical protein
LSGVVSSSKFMLVCFTFFLGIVFIFSIHFPLTLTKGMMESFVEHINEMPIDDIIDVPDHYYESAKKSLIASHVNRFMARYFMLHIVTYLICLLLFYRIGHRLSGYIGGLQSAHQKQLEQLVRDSRGISLALSSVTKLCVLCMFVFISVILWQGLFTCAAIVASCIFPSYRSMHISNCPIAKPRSQSGSGSCFRSLSPL